jgi:hypothetical protein
MNRAYTLDPQRVTSVEDGAERGRSLIELKNDYNRESDLLQTHR